MLFKIVDLLFRLISKIKCFCIYYSYRRKFSISSDFRFNGCDIQFYGDGDLIIGKNSYIGRNSYIQVFEGCKVQIGNNCSISHYVRMYTSTNIADQDFSVNKNDISKVCGNIVIGSNCWIGASVFITENINIGENTVVGANSVVSRNLPPHSICGGVPAKVIKFKSYLNPDEKKDLIKRFHDVLSEKLKKN